VVNLSLCDVGDQVGRKQVWLVDQGKVALWVELRVVWWHTNKSHCWENVFNYCGYSAVFI
jgi:hypothetical protein